MNSKTKKKHPAVKKNIKNEKVVAKEQIFNFSQCSLHSISNQFYCTVCESLTCPKCVISSTHSSHADKQIDLEELQTPMNPQNNAIQFIQQNISSQKTRLKLTKDKVLSQVENFFTLMETEIEQPIECFKKMEQSKIEFLKTISDSSRKTGAKKKAVRNFIDCYQPCKKLKTQDVENQIYLNETIIKEGLNELLENNIIVREDQVKTQSSIEGQLKYLHWFEWGKRKLSLYDLTKNNCEIIDLNINFKVPSFSRSLMFSKTSNIYLFGGEEPEYHPRKDVYLFNLHQYRLTKNSRLTSQNKMPMKKFDFTLVEMDGLIYILSGKNGSGEIANTCHQFNPVNQSYKQIASLNFPRYASSAAAIYPNIYIFGGRGNSDNHMIQQIEIYNVHENRWIELKVHSNFYDIYVPVEVCGCIAISQNEILLFGGCSNDIKDQNKSYIFNTEKNIIQQKIDMVISQVFVTPPFVFGKNIYAIGNEYYLKQRSLHKYDIKKDLWTILI